jgi:hypothetical protein
LSEVWRLNLLRSIQDFRFAHVDSRCALGHSGHRFVSNKSWYVACLLTPTANDKLWRCLTTGSWNFNRLLYL